MSVERRRRAATFLALLFWVVATPAPAAIENSVPAPQIPASQEVFLLGFGNPPQAATTIDTQAFLDTGFTLIGFTAKMMVLPLLALLLGVAMFSIGGPGAPLFRKVSAGHD